MTTGQRISRRGFLAGVGATAATIGLGEAAEAAQPSVGFPAPAPTRDEHYRAVVVGSGFGGGVAALRLARAGVRTLVVERGRWWTSVPNDNTFPRFYHPDRRVSWLESTPVVPSSPPAVFKPYTGLVERVRGLGMSVLCGAGVGGGSLHYEGISLQPSEELFTRVMPSSVDYGEMAAVYYPRVAAMLHMSPTPDDILNHVRYTSSRKFLADAERAGTDGVRVLQPMNWDVIRAELRGDLPPWSSHGEYLYGVNNGARYSVDKTYLAEAVATGLVTIAPLHVVKELAPGSTTRYVLRCHRIDTDGVVQENVVVHTDTVLLNAGSANTSKLLVRAKGSGTMPSLPPDVGRYWGTNGDRVFLRTEPLEFTLPHQGGPTAIAALDWDAPTGPATLFHPPAPFDVETFSMYVAGMAIPNGHGAFHYDPLTDSAQLVWPPTSDVEPEVAIDALVTRMALTSGGVFAPVQPVDPNTFHPLGGAVIGPVCDPHGRVHDNPGLYVTDGSLIPGSTACCNPSWTITALAERCLDRIVAQDVGTII
ncbi:GMC oxidoreductase [Saccharothrix algeriensis]|uniref:Cholesterol oxidase n=1 Tax=Saccharothrix algeriensis TaxID=173560 RepID=A0A8T8HWT3_9PSEU|nr:GMC oxidoreductase [Saccharothrix algeriensis]MBM7814806.1 cholesterol oxidase [Saccharothrix algeriensis]QTR03073.1 GMC family oxidoreductase [Saccharothrix algeriensis]